VLTDLKFTNNKSLMKRACNVNCCYLASFFITIDIRVKEHIFMNREMSNTMKNRWHDIP